MILTFLCVWSLLVLLLLRVGLCFACFDLRPFCTAVEFLIRLLVFFVRFCGCELSVLRSLH